MPFYLEVGHWLASNNLAECSIARFSTHAVLLSLEDEFNVFISTAILLRSWLTKSEKKGSDFEPWLSLSNQARQRVIDDAVITYVVIEQIAIELSSHCC